jgi:hypothetical protein
MALEVRCKNARRVISLPTFEVGDSVFAVPLASHFVRHQRARRNFAKFLQTDGPSKVDSLIDARVACCEGIRVLQSAHLIRKRR